MAAQQWAIHMAQTGVLDHGDTFTRIERAGYHWQNAGENIEMGSQTADTVFGDWTGSPKHHANIVGNFRDVGFGHALDSRGQHWWAADFGSQ